MRSRGLIQIAAVGCLQILACICCHNAAADILVLNDGNWLRGELISETEREVTFRFEVNGIWGTKTFHRAEVAQLRIEEGDQSDAGGATKPVERPEPAKPEPVEPGRVIAVIPLEGRVGLGLDDDVRRTITPQMVKLALEEAARRGASIIVLDIESPGGLLDDMEEICEMVLEASERFRVVAWPREAYSAAAIITMCCPEIIVRPNSIFGAATIIKAQGGRMTPLEAKLASPHYAKQRGYMDRSGQPYDVVAAMTIQDTRLWWSPTHGFTTTQPTDRADWQEIDTATTILSITGNDALKWRLAAGEARHSRDLLNLIEAETERERWRIESLAEFVNDYSSQLERDLADVIEQFTIYGRGIAAIDQLLVQAHGFLEQGNRAGFNHARSLIAAEVRRMKQAAGLIRRAMKTKPTIEMNNEVFERIAADEPLLTRIVTQLNRNETTGWNEAAKSLIELIEAWQKLVDS